MNTESDAMTAALVMLRGYVIWALLIGQGVVIALFLIDRRTIDNPWGAEIVIAIIAVSGLVGLAGETWWRSRKVRG